jgi:arylsulfatase A-like enzyme
MNSTFVFNRGVELLWCSSRNGEENLRKGLAAYYSLISLIDREIGRILDTLDDTGQRENTIVVFCADHGDYAGEYSRMAKGWNYDAIHRVPFIWNWKNHIPCEAAYSGLVETVDFFPTICRLAGIPVPKTVQGLDLSPIFAGKRQDVRDAAFYEFVGVKTVRTKEYKLSYGYDGDKEIGELFDLKSDPYEYKNLFYDDNKRVVREKLLRRILDWHISTQQPVNFNPQNENLPHSRWFELHDAEVEEPQ